MHNHLYIPPFPWDLDALPFVVFADRTTIPASPGIYFVRNNTDLLYVGASKNICQRLKSHHHMATFQAYEKPLEVAWMPIITNSPTSLRTYESRAIDHYRPRLNRPPSQRMLQAHAFYTMDELDGKEVQDLQGNTK